LSTTPPIYPVKNITLPLKTFIDILLQYREYVEIKDPTVARIIWLHDKEEDICHVEFPSDEQEHAQLYSKKTWIESVYRRERLKQQLTEEKEIFNEIHEKTQELRLQVAKRFKLNPKNPKHVKTINALADVILDKDSVEVAQQIGVDISKTPQAPYKLTRKGRR
jgi:hypothetical protein